MVWVKLCPSLALLTDHLPVRSSASSARSVVVANKVEAREKLNNSRFITLVYELCVGAVFIVCPTHARGFVRRNELRARLITTGARTFQSAATLGLPTVPVSA